MSEKNSKKKFMESATSKTSINYLNSTMAYSAKNVCNYCHLKLFFYKVNSTKHKIKPSKQNKSCIKKSYKKLTSKKRLLKLKVQFNVHGGSQTANFNNYNNKSLFNNIFNTDCAFTQSGQLKTWFI